MYYIGVDLGGTNIAVGIVDEKMNILVKDSVPTRPDRDPEAIVQDMTDLARRLLEAKGIPLSEVAYAGIATPGIANREAGIVEYACNLPFRNFAISEVFARYLPLPHVYIENDANAAALAEALAGAARGTKDSIMITLGTGVGGGIIINGRVYSGFNFAGGELGHVVIQHGGRLCSCGRRGCWEAYSSAPALTEMTREAIAACRAKGIPTQMSRDADEPGRVNARTAFDAAKAGDAEAQRVVDTYISYLACGIANMINIFQPEVITIGGGISGEGENLRLPLEREVMREQYARASRKKTRVCMATLGNDAGIIGAAGLGL